VYNLNFCPFELCANIRKPIAGIRLNAIGEKKSNHYGGYCCAKPHYIDYNILIKIKACTYKLYKINYAINMSQ